LAAPERNSAPRQREQKMSKVLRVLIVEDSEDDVLLLVRNLRQGDFDPIYEVVENASSMRAALEKQAWDVVISDYALPQFNGPAALKLLQEIGLDLPFIIVSGTIGEETAVTAMKAGAHDYLMKSNLVRLGPVVERELQDARGRHARKQAETALGESEERFRQVIFSISDWIYVTRVTETGEQVSLYFSPHVETLTGYPYENFITDWHFWPSVVIHPDDRAAAAEQAARLASGQSSEVEYRLIRADGEIVWVRDSARVETESTTSKLIYGVVSNITERKQLEEQFHQSQRMEAIGRLAGGVAHDFNNILTVITGYSDLLLYQHPDDHDSERNELEQIKKAAEQATSLTRQLLAFSRKQVLQPRILNLNTIVAHVETMLRRLIGEDIELVTILKEGLGQVKADPGQMEQVIMNLAVNARDAMPHGGKLTIETAHVELDEAYAHQHIGAKPGPYVMLDISDTGHGMDAKTRSHIFEPFFTTKESGKGTGLGLAMVHGIINQSDGYIWVYSEPNQGTTFKVYLPQVEVSIPSNNQPSQVPIPSSRGSETILLVEDEDSVRKLAHHILLNEGYRVLEAPNGEEALQVSEGYAGPIHLLLTDIVMPGGMSGRQLADCLSALRPQMKILYMSGYTDDAIVHHGVLDADLAFLQKPFTLNTLMYKVREVLDAQAV
jgi:two-component system, cell cycle sensor histidine kinase and response regulator CckA